MEAAEPNVKAKPKKKLDGKIPDAIREKSYVTRQVDTSITLLETPENDVVLEALLFLSKYADIKITNLSYPQQKAILVKLLNLFHRNICILRLVLRLLNQLLNMEDILIELDQECYDDNIKEITDLYITHNDAHVKEFCIGILSKLATSCRITCLIFKVDLFKPMLATIKSSKTVTLLESTMECLYVLLQAPAALSLLPTIENFEGSIIMARLDSPEPKIAETAYKIILRLTSINLEVFQAMFKKGKLVEKMMEVVMNQKLKQFYDHALTIIQNCMNSELTNSYFVETLVFLEFCQWVKSCDPKHILPCVSIFEALSKISSIKQMLFDLSVEDSILFFLRSTEKKVLNKTCNAISYMSEHKFCCDKMINNVVMKALLEILLRKDEEDPENEVALHTIANLARRSTRALDLLYAFGAQNILLEYFKKGVTVISEQSYMDVVEILYKFAVHPVYQISIINDKFFGELLRLLQEGGDKIALFSVEVLSNFLGNSTFKKMFINLNGPRVFLDKIKYSENPKLLKGLLLFLLCSLTEGRIMADFLKKQMVQVLKNMPPSIRERMPLVDRILQLTYNVHLPMKLFETQKIEITDKLKNNFYIINGKWDGPFPFLEILQLLQVSTRSTIYVVDNSFEVFKFNDSQTLLSSRESKTSDTVDSVESESFDYTPESPFDIRYGELSPDPYLPRYIYHITKYLKKETAVKGKIEILAEYIDTLLCGPEEDATMPQKIHTFKLHIEALKHKLGTNMIPIGFLRIGFHCERALLFKAMADNCCIPCSLVKGASKLYWNEVALLESERTLKFYIVDLMKNIGNLMVVGSREANEYCGFKPY